MGGRAVGTVDIDRAERPVAGRRGDDGGGRGLWRRCTAARRPRSARPRCRASPTATCRSTRARTTPRRSTSGGRIGGRRHASRRWTSTSSSTPSTPRPARGLQQFIQGQATYFGGRSKDVRAGAQVPQPDALSTTSRADPRAGRRRRGLRALPDRHVPGRRRDRRAPRRADAAGRQRQHHRRRDRRRERGARPGARACCRPPCARRNTTFVNLRAALDDLDVLVAESKPATKDLDTLFARLQPARGRRRPDDPRPAPAHPHAGQEQRPDRPHREAASARELTSTRLPAHHPHVRPLAGRS